MLPIDYGEGHVLDVIPCHPFSPCLTFLKLRHQTQIVLRPCRWGLDKVVLHEVHPTWIQRPCNLISFCALHLFDVDTEYRFCAEWINVPKKLQKLLPIQSSFLKAGLLSLRYNSTLLRLSQDQWGVLMHNNVGLHFLLLWFLLG
jgi:hypothetical protein